MNKKDRRELKRLLVGEEKEYKDYTVLRIDERAYIIYTNQGFIELENLEEVEKWIDKQNQ